MVGEEKFRSVMGHFATGVTVVTTRNREGDPTGLTVNAFTSVSLDPPLVLVCVHEAAASHDPLLEVGYFAVNVLSASQEGLALLFSRGVAEERFRGLETRDAPRGSPLLPGVVAWLECRVRDVYPGGDHHIIVGEVLTGDEPGGDPLLFHRGRLMSPSFPPDA